jgi:transposase-like protein
MHTPEIQKPQVGRRRGRYSDEFKRQVIVACLEPGVSTAAIALANGLNANLARRWVAESAQRSDTLRSKMATTLAPVHTNPAFIPVKFESVPPPCI